MVTHACLENFHFLSATRKQSEQENYAKTLVNLFRGVIVGHGTWSTACGQTQRVSALLVKIKQQKITHVDLIREEHYYPSKLISHF